MKVNRFITNVCSDHLQRSADFYCELFGLDKSFESDWFMLLQSDHLELGIVKRSHDIVPEKYKHKASGFYLTFVVNNVETVHQKLIKTRYPIVDPPQDTFYGQRRMLITDPDGTLIDISSPVEGFQFE
ncbi:hypothetical protein FNH22_07090 [Fulvivirga sp. M361]|uniref:VOC family protein n=1 Tax=Fulvivirga sp. M361 TaxID=2594266 RepID=UPI00117B9B39|nr:VOC family protein [Fulvivirga sp. M361]TRX60799.1 hypothetical protein FNH22_07090 [Fulvivirga sp. M361]